MASGLSYVTYGSVTLYRVVTHEVSQEPVLDESGTDMLYSRIRVNVSGFLHGHTDWNYLSQTPAGIDGDCATAHKSVRYQLPPRLSFKLVVGANNDYSGGTALIACNPAPINMIPPPAINANINLYQIDLANGPKCTSFVVTHITGNELFAVDATFEIHMLECSSDGAVSYNTYGILNNRWSTHDSIDSNMRTTRTYTGVVTLASANLNAQMLRWIVAPPLQPLFRRERMDFLCTEDGLKIRWTIVDVEIAVAAPFPARKWDIRHNVEMKGIDGRKLATSSIDVSLEADSRVNKADLIEIAIYVMTQKLLGKKPNELARVDSSYIVDSVSFSDFIGDVNRITASARCHKVADVAEGIFGAFSKFGLPLDSTALPSPLNGSNGGVGANSPYNAGTGQAYDIATSWGGYAGQIPDVEGPAQIVGIFACFLQSPCDDLHQMLLPTQGLPTLNISQQQNDQRVAYTATIATEIPQNTNPIYSPSQLSNAYVFWQIDSLYHRRMMTVQMPIAAIQATPYSATSAFVQLCPGQQQWILRCHAERVGDWPEFFDPSNLPAWPTPASPPAGYSAPTMVVLDYRIKPGTPQFSATGQPIYRASVEYLIGLSRPLTPEESLLIGNDKWNNQGRVLTDDTLTNSSW